MSDFSKTEEAQKRPCLNYSEQLCSRVSQNCRTLRTWLSYESVVSKVAFVSSLLADCSRFYLHPSHKSEYTPVFTNLTVITRFKKPEYIPVFKNLHIDQFKNNLNIYSFLKIFIYISFKKNLPVYEFLTCTYF